MACCQGQKIPMEELFPEELKGLRKQLTGYMGGNIGQGATPYGGDIAAPVNPASNAALNMIMGMMGHGGYKPGPGVQYTGGVQGSPYGSDDGRTPNRPYDPLDPSQSRDPIIDLYAPRTKY